MNRILFTIEWRYGEECVQIIRYCFREIGATNFLTLIEEQELNSLLLFPMECNYY